MTSPRRRRTPSSASVAPAAPAHHGSDACSGRRNGSSEDALAGPRVPLAAVARRAAAVDQPQPLQLFGRDKRVGRPQPVALGQRALLERGVERRATATGRRRCRCSRATPPRSSVAWSAAPPPQATAVAAAAVRRRPARAWRGASRHRHRPPPLPLQPYDAAPASVRQSRRCRCLRPLPSTAAVVPRCRCPPLQLPPPPPLPPPPLPLPLTAADSRSTSETQLRDDLSHCHIRGDRGCSFPTPPRRG